MVGRTSSVRPTSRYCTLLVEYVPPVVALVPEVITGTRSPTRILAFSLFLARIRGLDSTLVSPTVFNRSTVALREEMVMVFLFCLLRSPRTSWDALEPAAAAVTAVGARVTLVG